MSKIKTIPAGRFLYESGLLFEINRRILHPLGLALMIKYNDKDGTLSDEEAKISLMDKLWDVREDPEGMIFDEEGLSIGKEKFKKFWEEFGQPKILKRTELLGFGVQASAEIDVEEKQHEKSQQTIMEKNIKLKNVKTEDEVVDKENYGKIKKYIGQKHKQVGKSKECISTGKNTVYSPIPGGAGIVICTDCGQSLNDPDLNT